MELPGIFQSKIVEFLKSLPIMHGSDSQRAFIYHAGLDRQLQDQISFGKPTSEFVPLLITKLLDYGTLNNGQNALEAVLETAKTYIGQDRQIDCESLLQELHSYIKTSYQVVPKIETREVEEVCRFLEEIENEFKYVPIFHPPHRIVLQDQYIPIEVTVERRYRHDIETTWGYVESGADLTNAYALKGISEDFGIRTDQISWEDAREKYQRMMVLADPGMGKTVLLKMEALTTAQRERRYLEQKQKNLEHVNIPLFLRLSDVLKDSGSGMADTILQRIQYRYPKTPREIIALIRQKLENGKCILLLDALDEVPKEDRRKLAEELNIFARTYPCPMLCTSRVVGYEGNFLPDAREVEIIPFRQQQIDKYIETWFKNTIGYMTNESISAQGFIYELRQRPQLQGLAQNPLLLSLLCSLYQEKEPDLPSRRVHLYAKTINLMLRDWSRNRKSQPEGRIIAKIRLIEELAYLFSSGGKEIFSYDELFGQIEAYLHGNQVLSVFKHTDSVQLLTELTEDDGVIQKLDGEGFETRYIFLHRTFQEYFAAAYLKRAIEKDSQTGLTLARERFWDYDWHETLSVLAGLLNQPTMLLQTILDEKDDIFNTMLLLSGRCISECREYSDGIVAEIIEKIYQLWQVYPQMDFITAVIVSIGRIHALMFEKLKILLTQDEQTCKRGIEILGNIGTLMTVETLCSTLKHENNKTKGRAAEKLGQIGNPTAISSLLSILDDEDGQVRRSVVWALGMIGSPIAIDALCKTVTTDGYSIARHQAAWALERIGIPAPQAITSLCQALTDEDDVVREHATSALGVLGNPDVVPLVCSVLSDRSERVKREAVRALEKLKDPQSIPALYQALWDDDIRWNVAQALRGIGSPEAIDALITSLDSENYDIIYTVTDSLKKLDHPKVINTLSAILEHEPNTTVSETVASAWWGVEHPGMFDECSRLLQSEDTEERQTAVEVLGEIGTPDALSLVCTALQDENDRIRWWAAEILGEKAHPIAVESLCDALSDKDIGVRERVFFALARIGDTRALPHLLAIIKDDNNRDQEASAVALGMIGDPRAITGLLSVLNVPNNDLKRNAAEALEKISTIEIWKQLIQRPEIDLYDPEIFRLARTLAIRFSRSKPMPPLIPLYLEVLVKKQVEFRVRPDQRKSHGSSEK